MEPKRENKIYFECVDHWMPYVTDHVVSFLVSKNGDELDLCYSLTLLANALVDDINSIKSFEIETPSLWAGRHRQTIDEDGRLALRENCQEYPFRFAIRDLYADLPGSAQTLSSSHADPFSHPRFVGRHRWPGLTISATDCHLQTLLPRRELIDLELLGSSPSYGGIDDLAIAMNVPRDLLLGSGPPRTEWIITPPSVLLDTCSLDEVGLTIEAAHSPAISPTQVRLELRHLTITGNLIRETLAGSDMDWTNDEARQRSIITTFAHEAVISWATLMIDDIFCSQIRIEHQTRHLQKNVNLFSAAFPGNNIKDTVLNCPESQFEEAINLLFSLYGYATLHFGKISSLKDSSDILILDSVENLYVIECTNGEVDSNGKLRKLKSRSEIIEKNLSAGGRQPSSITPVMITRLRRDEIGSSANIAGGFGISLLCHEELIVMLDNINIPTPHNRFHEFVVRNIPRREYSSEIVV